MVAVLFGETHLTFIMLLQVVEDKTFGLKVRLQQCAAMQSSS